MRAVDIIEKKRNGGELSREEIRWLIHMYTSGQIPDYQLSAWAMAVYFQGMTTQETAELTLAMAQSGETLDLTAIQPPCVDKH
ncbi:MAG: pyrimidine-nucleoside phosphorylase, partial [Peptococcaceae bacterium]|nr:pyrimidine-nucleoside phosphorylase [Peptococcaceae bacterium]